MPTEFSVGLRIYIYILAFIFGACIFSFTNCAADRYIEKQSVFKGRSHCTECGHTLGILDLIPIFGYLFLRGKCRYCGAKIPISCLITELLGGIGYLLIIMKFGLSFVSLELALLAPALMAVAIIDIRTMEIPDGLVVYMALLFVIFSATYPDMIERLGDGTVCAVVLGGGLLLISLIMDKLLKKDSLGGGDIKLFAAVGLFLGLPRGLLTVILACISGLLSALILRKKNSNGEFPFGPAICLAAFVSLLVGSDVIDLYISLFI